MAAAHRDRVAGSHRGRPVPARAAGGASPGPCAAVVLRPLAGVPTLEAELYDGTGTVTLVWLGRRRIRGIDPGRTLVARGRLTKRDGQPTLFNPEYELRAAGG